MGTRGILGFIIRNRRKNRTYKKGTYNRWDSYPTHLGVKIMEFIKSLSEEQLKMMAENVDKLVWVNESERPSSELQIRYAPLSDLTFGNQSSANWYCLLGKVQGADVLPLILDGTVGHLIDSTEFNEDYLFCEFAYWIDWEERKIFIEGGSRMYWTKPFSDLTEDGMREIQDVVWTSDTEDEEIASVHDADDDEEGEDDEDAEPEKCETGAAA